MSFTTAVHNWWTSTMIYGAYEGAMDKRAAKRFDAGYKWAQSEWDKRHERFPHKIREEQRILTRDAIANYIDSASIFGFHDKFDDGAKQFLWELSNGKH